MHTHTRAKEKTKKGSKRIAVLLQDNMIKAHISLVKVILGRKRGLETRKEMEIVNGTMGEEPT